MLDLAMDADLQANSGPLALVGPAPCDSCRLAPRCAAELLACAAFQLYATTGRAPRWRLAPRAPTRERFDLIFPSAVRIGPQLSPKGD